MIPAIILSLGMMVFPEVCDHFGRRAMDCLTFVGFRALVGLSTTIGESDLRRSTITSDTLIREAEALEILADLHGKGDPTAELVQLEFVEIKGQVQFERTEGAKSYMDLLKPGIFRRVGLGAALQMWSQLSGMNIMMSASLFMCHPYYL